MDMFSLVIAALLAGRLLDPVTRDPTLIMLVVMGLLLAAATITIVGGKESPTSQGEGVRGEGGLLSPFRIDLRQHSSYWWLIAERLLFLLGIYGMQAFAQYYLQDVLRVPDPPKQTGDLLAALTLTLVLLVLIGGWLTDKYGAKRILAIGTFIAAGGMLLMPFRHRYEE
jgi:MFS family permease